MKSFLKSIDICGLINYLYSSVCGVFWFSIRGFRHFHIWAYFINVSCVTVMIYNSLPCVKTSENSQFPINNNTFIIIFHLKLKQVDLFHLNTKYFLYATRFIKKCLKSCCFQRNYFYYRQVIQSMSRCLSVTLELFK